MVPGYLLKPTKTSIFIDFTDFSHAGYATEASKKYIKVIKNPMKIDAVDPWAAADNPPTPPGHNG